MEVDKLTEISNEALVMATKKHFARLGMPDFVLTDNSSELRSTNNLQKAGSLAILQAPHIIAKAMVKLSRL